MIKNFLFVLKRFKTSSVINILGLSVAFAVLAVVLIQAKYDFTYDKSYPDAGDIYMQSFYAPGEKTPVFYSNQQMPAEIKAVFPEVQAYCIVDNTPHEIVIPSSEGEKKIFTENVLTATPGFMDVFAPTVIDGNTAGLFVESDKAMISHRTATKLFGDESPVGKFVQLDEKQLAIIAVYRDFPENSSIDNGILTAMEESDLSAWSYRAFYRMAKRDYAGINDKINDKINERWMLEFEGTPADVPEDLTKSNIIPLGDYYMQYSGKGSLNGTLALLAIGIAMIAIAFINFINLTVALIPSRIRSVNIRKILGDSLFSLRTRVAMEAVFLSATALALACFYIHAFSSSALASFFSADLSPAGDNIPLLAATGAGLLAVSFLLGLYPAYCVTSVSPVMALGGTFSLSPRGARLRNTLTVVQFAASIVLIVMSVFINMQNRYMQDYDWGFRKENVVYLSGANMKSNIRSFRDDVMQNPAVAGFTTAGFIPGNVQMNVGREFRSQSVYLTVWPVAPNFLDFFGIPVLYGNGFDLGDASGREKIIFNEAFLRRYGFDTDIVGGTFNAFDEADVTGIARDVNFASLHQPIMPMAFVIINSPYWQDNYVYLKLSGGDIRSTIDYVRGVWEKHNDKPFEFAFLDARLNELYKNENNLAKVISIFGLIAVIIAVMGVYGLVVFNARYKAKEIAIRKVNGSTIEEIMLLLNRNVLVQLAIAFIIAVPAAYIAVGKWLENFAYKTDVYWWVFLLGGVIVLVITVLTVSAQSYRAASRNPTKALNSQ
jgi:putative ABC transport system permease protein